LFWSGRGTPLFRLPASESPAFQKKAAKNGMFLLGDILMVSTQRASDTL
jgi:hypothetical protein